MKENIGGMETWEAFASLSLCFVRPGFLAFGEHVGGSKGSAVHSPYRFSTGFAKA